MVYFKPWHLLFGEAGAVPGYCLPARTATAIVPKVLRLPPGNYIDDFIAAPLPEDSTTVNDLWEFLVDMLRFQLSVPSSSTARPSSTWEWSSRSRTMVSCLSLRRTGGRSTWSC